MALILATFAAALIGLDLAIFFVWTQPANAATANWTTRPEDWLDLRRQWEYSHAINAGIMFVAFGATTAASLRGKATAQNPWGRNIAGHWVTDNRRRN